MPCEISFQPAQAIEATHTAGYVLELLKPGEMHAHWAAAVSPEVQEQAWKAFPVAGASSEHLPGLGDPSSPAHRGCLASITPSSPYPLTVLWEPHKFRWVTGQADPPGVAGAHSKLVLAAWGQVFNDKIGVQSWGHWLLPDLRAYVVGRERRRGDGDSPNVWTQSRGLVLAAQRLYGQILEGIS